MPSSSFYYDPKEEKSPALLIHEVQVFSLETDYANSLVFRGKIDTGARASAIPEGAIDDLELQFAGEIKATDFDGVVHNKPTYWIRLEIEDIVNKVVKVISSKREDILIGRDVLSELKLTANAKTRELSLEKP